jgi:hypothetical protein
MFEGLPRAVNYVKMRIILELVENLHQSRRAKRTMSELVCMSVDDAWNVTLTATSLISVVYV